MIDWNPSKRHFQHTNQIPYNHHPDNVDYFIKVENDILYIYFQATTGQNKKELANDWAYNLDFFPKTFDIFPGSKIQAHEGLAQQYLAVRKEILDELYSLKYKKIYVTGYSQGGAIATACVQDIGFHIDRDNLPVSVSGISYNGPRFFTTKEKKLIEKSVLNRLIIIKGHNDPVGHLPFKAMPSFFTFRWNPFHLRLKKPSITFWKDYGKSTWIGSLFRLWPCQHNSEEIEKNLLKKFKE